MKKTYINPEWEVIEIKAAYQLLADSEVGMGSGDKDPSIGDAPGFGDLDTNMFGF